MAHTPEMQMPLPGTYRHKPAAGGCCTLGMVAPPGADKTIMMLCLPKPEVKTVIRHDTWAWHEIDLAPDLIIEKAALIVRRFHVNQCVNYS